MIMNKLLLALLFILFALFNSTSAALAAGQEHPLALAYSSAEDLTPGPAVSQSEKAAAVSGNNSGAETLVQGGPLAVKLSEGISRNSLAVKVVWTLFCAFLVFFMQAGFAMVETGFTRAKNAGHTMAMNLMVIVFSILGYWACGYAFQSGGKGLFSLRGVRCYGRNAVFNAIRYDEHRGHHSHRRYGGALVV